MRPFKEMTNTCSSSMYIHIIDRRKTKNGQDYLMLGEKGTMGCRFAVTQ